MALRIRERNGRFHIYEDTTEPWALVTAFDEREAAEAYVEGGRIRSEAFDVHLGPWVPEVVQEEYKCVVCKHTLWAGKEAYVRVVTISGTKTEKRIEARCLDHIRTRFERDEPV